MTPGLLAPTPAKWGEGWQITAIKMNPSTSLPGLAPVPPKSPNFFFPLCFFLCGVASRNHRQKGCKFPQTGYWKCPSVPWDSAAAPDSSSGPGTNFLGGLRPHPLTSRKKILKLINNLPRSFQLWHVWLPSLFYPDLISPGHLEWGRRICPEKSPLFVSWLAREPKRET